MKRTRIFTGTVLMALFTLAGAFCSSANTDGINGHLDSVVGNSVAGWMWNANAPEETQTVTVTVTNRQTGEVAASATTMANEFRSDLLAKGKGSGNYGFHVEIVWENLPEAHYSINVAAAGKTIDQTMKHTVGNPAPEPIAQTASVSGNLVSLGIFKTTAYCPCYQCSEGWGRSTSSGAKARARHTVAVDTRVIPMGSRLLINGVEYVAEDIGGGVKGNHIDIFYDTHAETRQHGTRSMEVFLIK